MKGKYTTPTGKEVEVLDFDEANKMVYADLGEGDKRWIGEPEYKEWESTEPSVEKVKKPTKKK